jgi:serine protease inhibitor
MKEHDRKRTIKDDFRLKVWLANAVKMNEQYILHMQKCPDAQFRFDDLVNLNVTSVNFVQKLVGIQKAILDLIKEDESYHNKKGEECVKED